MPTPHNTTNHRRLVAGVSIAGVVVCGAIGITAASADPAPTQAAGACTTTAHIGDSTSIGMTDPQFLPDTTEQLPAQYAAIAGVHNTIVDAASGRAVVEQIANASPGVDAIAAANTHNPDCYVIALGDNDAANEAADSAVTAAERIDRVMALTNGKPVLWPTVKTTAAAAAPADNTAMIHFNDALRAATGRYPNLHVFDWAAQATDDLFFPDGIHYTVEGTKARIAAFAHALSDMSHTAATAQTPSAEEAADIADTTSVDDTTSPETTDGDTTTPAVTTPTIETTTATETSTATTSVTTTATPPKTTVTVTATPPTTTITATTTTTATPAR